MFKSKSYRFNWGFWSPFCFRRRFSNSANTFQGVWPKQRERASSWSSWVLLELASFMYESAWRIQLPLNIEPNLQSFRADNLNKREILENLWDSRKPQIDSDWQMQVTRKNPKTTPEKLAFRKYDPVVRQARPPLLLSLPSRSCLPLLLPLWSVPASFPCSPSRSRFGLLAFRRSRPRLSLLRRYLLPFVSPSSVTAA